MASAIEQVLKKKIIPVVAIHDAAQSDALAEALISGGLPCAEITFRTAAAPDAIYAMAQRGDMLVTRAKEDLGYTPTPLEQGLMETAEWMKELSEIVTTPLETPLPAGMDMVPDLDEGAV